MKIMLVARDGALANAGDIGGRAAGQRDRALVVAARAQPEPLPTFSEPYESPDPTTTTRVIVLGPLPVELDAIGFAQFAQPRRADVARRCQCARARARGARSPR